MPTLTNDELDAQAQQDYLDSLMGEGDYAKPQTDYNAVLADFDRRQQEQQATWQFRGGGPTEREAAPFTETLGRAFMPELAQQRPTIPEVVKGAALAPLRAASEITKPAFNLVGKMASVPLRGFAELGAAAGALSTGQTPTTEQIAEAEQSIQPGQSVVHIPRTGDFEIGGVTIAPDQISKIVEGFLTPDNIALFPFAASKGVQAAFLSQTVPGAIDAAERTFAKNLPENERRDAATDLLLNTVFSYALGRGMASREVTPTEREMYASKDRETAALYGDVLRQSEQGPQALSAESRGEGIHAQEKVVSNYARGLLDQAATEQGARTEFVSKFHDEDTPFAKPGRMATIRPDGTIEIKPGMFEDWLSKRPTEQHPEMIRSMIGEELNHQAVTPDQAEAFVHNMTPWERAMSLRIYTGEWTMDAFEDKYGYRLTDAQLGYEAINRFQMRLARMTLREVAEAATRERWTVRSLDALANVVYQMRRAMGTKGSRAQADILDRVLANVSAARTVAAMNQGKDPNSPGAFVKDQPQVEPEPRPGERWVTIRRPDGTAYRATVGRGDYDVSEFPKMVERYGTERIPSVATWLPDKGAWTDGMMAPGEVIVENAPGAFIKRTERELTLPPMEEGEARPSAEDLGALKWHAITPGEIERTATEHISKETRPNFKAWVADARARFGGDLKPGQLRETWHDAVWKELMNAPGSKLEALRRSMGLVGERSGEFKIADPIKVPTAVQPKLAAIARELPFKKRTPAAVRQSFSEAQRRRLRVVADIATKLLREAEEGKKAWKRDTLDPTDVGSTRKSKQPVYRSISGTEAADPERLGGELTEDARSSGLPVSVTKRAVAMRGKDGRVHLVSIFRDGFRGPVVLDPLDPGGKHHRVASVWKNFRPIASVLLDEPVKNFHQTFKNISEYQKQFGEDARRLAESEASFPEPLREEPEEPGTLAVLGELKDAEAGSVLDSVMDELRGDDLSSPEDFQLMIDGMSDRAKTGQLTGRDRQVISALQKSYTKTLARNPELTADQAIERTLNEYYKAAIESKSGYPSTYRDNFVKRIFGTFGQTVETAVPIKPATPGAFDKGIGALNEATTRATEGTADYLNRIEAYALGKINRDAVTSSRDAAENKANIASDQAGRYIQLPSASKKLPNGDPQVLAAARTMIAASAYRIEYDVPARAEVKLEKLLDDDLDVQLAKNLIGSGDFAKIIQGHQIYEGRRRLFTRQLVHQGDIDRNTRHVVYNPGSPQATAVFLEQIDQGNATAQKLIDGKAHWQVTKAADGPALGMLSRVLNKRMGKRWLANGKELKAEVLYAYKHWNDPILQETAQRIVKETDDQYWRERAQGFRVNYTDDYMPGRYEEEWWDADRLRFGELSIMGERFRAEKTFHDYYEAHGVGPYFSVTPDSSALVAHRVRQGMRQVNQSQWAEALKNLTDPHTKLPLVASLNTDGTVPNPTYEPYYVARRKPMAVLKSALPLIKDMTGGSAIANNPASRGFLMTSQGLKHLILLGDFFHLGRLKYYDWSINGIGRGGYSKGLTVLEWRPEDVDEGVRKGLIRPEDAAWAQSPVLVRVKDQEVQTTNRGVAEALINRGLNVGRIADAIYKDVVKKIPLIGEGAQKYNRWLFDKMTRGQMLQTAVNEFLRQNKKYPNADFQRLLRDVSKDVNDYFGSIGRQGWITNPTMQDAIRMFGLAPQWVEGLVKKETSFVRQPISAEIGMRKGLPHFGTASRGIVRGLATMTALTQVLNLITRGKPTWFNNEEGHQWDAWIPDVTGKTDGFFISPLSIFNEITHDVVRLIENKPTVRDAIFQIGENKLGPYGKFALALATGESPTHRKYATTAGAMMGAASQLVPAPISIGRLGQAALSKATGGMVEPPAPGSVQRQIFGSAGIKIEPAATAEMEIRKKVQRFIQDNALDKSQGWKLVRTDQASYGDLERAVTTGNQNLFNRVFAELRKSHPVKDGVDPIVTRMQRWKGKPFTGSAANEEKFKQTLTTNELETYSWARGERLLLVNEFERMYQEARMLEDRK